MSVPIEKSRFSRGIQEIQRMTGQQHLVVTLKAACYLHARKEIPPEVPIDVIVPNRCALFEGIDQVKQGNLYGAKLEVSLCGLPFVLWSALHLDHEGRDVPLKYASVHRYSAPGDNCQRLIRLSTLGRLAMVYKDKSINNNFQYLEMIRDASNLMAFQLSTKILMPRY